MKDIERFVSSIKARGVIAAVLALAGGVMPAHATHYRVYLLGGQSNASGRADASELTGTLASAQTDVQLYWHKELVTDNGNLTQDAWVDLQPGSGQGKNSPSGHDIEFGCELSFGRTMADADTSVNIAIIKFGYGGSNLHTQWAESGDMYTDFVETVESGLAALTSAGDTYEMGGMIWIQGEADTGTAANANAYETNLSNLVERVRADVGDESIGGTTLPFVISRLSSSQYPALDNYYTTVCTAQETVAANMRQAAYVDTDGFSVYTGTTAENIHFDADGQIAIGEACAAAMLALEAQDADRDGLLVSEETTYGSDPDLADTDGDGQSDGVEVAAGTSPSSATSSFECLLTRVSDEEMTLSWPSRAGNMYDIKASTNLVDWTVLEADVDAVDPGSNTTWSVETVTATGQVVLALYDAETALNGDFNTTAFDSVDTVTSTTAGRITQGGSLTGGGTSSYVLDNALFDTSASGSTGFNLADCALADQAAAATAGDYFSFEHQPNDGSVTYESLSFYSDQFKTTGQVDVSYQIGTNTEVFVLQNYVPTISNASVTLKTVDFEDFSTDETVTWTFYLYGSAASTYGIRFDDIQLTGTVSDSDTYSTRFFRVRMTESSSF
jgi:hypothetical protein